MNAACDCGLDEFPWKLLNPRTGNVVSEYDSETEAKDAASWYEQSYGKTLDVRVVARSVPPEGANPSSVVPKGTL